MMLKEGKTMEAFNQAIMDRINSKYRELRGAGCEHNLATSALANNYLQNALQYGLGMINGMQMTATIQQICNEIRKEL